MGTTFTLPHEIDTVHFAGWLWYSHATQAPTDRPAIHGNGIVRPAGLRLANWYFLSDNALEVLGGSDYSLSCAQYDQWHLWIKEDDKAALFKLRFM